jgi:hypothetical protein
MDKEIIMFGMNKETITVVASLVSAITALTAVTVTPYSSFLIARRAAVADHRSSWIAEVRQAMASLVGLLYVANSSTQNLTTEQASKLVAAKTKIVLMLDFDKEHQKKLSSRISDAVEVVSKTKDQRVAKEFATAMAHVECAARLVLKHEWKRVEKM